MSTVITGRSVTHIDTTNVFQDLKPNTKKNAKNTRKPIAAQNMKRNVILWPSKIVLLFQKKIMKENARMWMNKFVTWRKLTKTRKWSIMYRNKNVIKPQVGARILKINYSKILLEIRNLIFINCIQTILFYRKTMRHNLAIWSWNERWISLQRNN